jgi:hypothetical protein
MISKRNLTTRHLSRESERLCAIKHYHHRIFHPIKFPWDVIIKRNVGPVFASFLVEELIRKIFCDSARIFARISRRDGDGEKMKKVNINTVNGTRCCSHCSCFRKSSRLREGRKPLKV